MSTTCPEWLPTHLYPFTHRHVEVDGTRVHYVDEGEGRPLLFVHGNPDYSFLFRQQIQALQADYRCLAVDLPGFGLSTAGRGYGFTPAEHATVVARFAARLDVRDTVLVVHDWGGPIGLEAAATAPDRYRGLILAGTLAWPDYRHQQPFWARWMMGYVASERGRRAAIERNLMVEGPVN